MKTRKEAFLTLLGITSLTIAAIAIFAPIQSHALPEGSKQYVSTECQSSSGASWGCNDCTSGSKTCTDHSCSQCSGS